MGDLSEQTPSLLSGMFRYWWIIALAVVLSIGVGFLAARQLWTPEVTLSAIVQTSNTSSDASADRSTASVAARLASGGNLTQAETATGIEIKEASAATAPGSSTIEITLSADSLADATTVALAVVNQYQAGIVAAHQAEIDRQLALIDESLASVRAHLAEAEAAALAASPTSAQFGVQNARRAELAPRELELTAQREALLLNTAPPEGSVVIVSGPDAGPSQRSLAVRYVPAAVVLGLLAAILLIALLVRRRPWLTDPIHASEILGAPLLAVGESPRGGSSRADVAPVIAHAATRAIGDQSAGIVLILSSEVIGGSRGQGRSGTGEAERLAADVASVLARVGHQVSVVRVDANGKIAVAASQVATGERVTTPGPNGDSHAADRGPGAAVEAVVDVSRRVAGGREILLSIPAEVGFVDDIVLVTVSPALESAVLLDLIALADVTVPMVRTGMPLIPLVVLRRDLDAVGVRPLGVVADAGLT